MSANTPAHNIPYMTGDDPLADVALAMQALAERVSLQLGESGARSVTPAGVDVVTSVRVNYIRTYDYTPKVWMQVRENVSTAADIRLWPSGEDPSGFTLNLRSSSTAARDIGWMARP